MRLKPGCFVKQKQPDFSNILDIMHIMHQGCLKNANFSIEIDTNIRKTVYARYFHFLSLWEMVSPRAYSCSANSM